MKLNIKGERDKQLRYAFIGLSALTLLMGAGNVLTGSLAWHFATTQKTITTPLTFNRPFASDSKSVDATGLTQFAASFIYWRLNVTPENIDTNQKMVLGFVPSAERDALKKSLDIEAERIKKAGITTQFDTKEIRVMDDGSVQYSGVLKSSTTNGAIITPLKDQEKTYRLKLSYDNGVINLHSFEELKPEPLNPDADVIARVRGEENTDGQEMKAAAGVRSELEGADKTAGEQSRASRVIADLANAERDMLRAAENIERGRMPEREEQTLTRTIQKER